MEVREKKIPVIMRFFSSRNNLTYARQNISYSKVKQSDFTANLPLIWREKKLLPTKIKISGRFAEE